METALEPLERRVLNYIREHNMLRCGESVLVGLSGGPDSVCLLHVLLHIKKALNITVRALHVEHGIRGASSDGDMVFCQDLCGRWGVGLDVERADVPARAGQHRVSLEVAAREVRREAMSHVMRVRGLDKYATGHHADDQIETMLLHMVRGAGLTGMRGILPANGVIVRPLLCVNRAEIMGYLNGLGIDYRTDETNAQPFTPRNALRANVLPVLYGINPKAGAAAARLSDALREDAETLDALALDCFNRRITDGVLDTTGWDTLTPAVRKRVLALCVTEWGGRCEAARLSALDAMVLAGGRGMSLDGVTVALSGDRLSRHTPDARAMESWEVVLAAEGITELPGGCTVELRMVERPEDVKGCSNTQYFDAEVLKGKVLTVRTRLDGDRMRLFGSGRHRLVSDILSDMKVPARVRGVIPILCADGRCVWIMGLRRAGFAEIGDDTERVLMVKYMNAND